MRLDETDERFCVRPSTLPGAGDGLFTRVSLAEGETLEVIGVLVEAGSVADRCTRYADAYKFRVGDLLLIPLGYAGMVNHSSRPNVEKVIDGRSVYLRTLRPIEAGEELFLTYGEGYFEATGLSPTSFSDGRSDADSTGD